MLSNTTIKKTYYKTVSAGEKWSWRGLSLACFTKLDFSLQVECFQQWKMMLAAICGQRLRTFWNAPKREILFYCPPFWLLWCFGAWGNITHSTAEVLKGQNRCVGIVKEGESWQKDRCEIRGVKENYTVKTESERLEKDGEWKMKWPDASLLPYLVIFIPLRVRFIYTSDKHHMDHCVQKCSSLPICTPLGQTTNYNSCLLACSGLYLIYCVIREWGVNRKSVHVISCRLIGAFKQSGGKKCTDWFWERISHMLRHN